MMGGRCGGRLACRVMGRICFSHRRTFCATYLMGYLMGGAPQSRPIARPGPFLGTVPTGGGIYERYTSPGGPGTTLGDIRNPELLHENAGSHSGFVLRNVPGLLAFSVGP